MAETSFDVLFRIRRLECLDQLTIKLFVGEPPREKVDSSARVRGKGKAARVVEPELIDEVPVDVVIFDYEGQGAEPRNISGKVSHLVVRLIF